MSNKLVNLTISAPGFYGLNKQTSSALLGEEWATEATNVIIDNSGRMSCRKGYQHTNTTVISGTPSFKTIHEYINISGNSIIIASAGNKIYKVVGTSLTDITGTITTPTDDNWKFVNLHGDCIGFQDNHAPIVITDLTGSFADISLTGTETPNTSAADVLSAFGRLWVLDGDQLRYSDALSYSAWNGAFDLSTVYMKGADKGVALAEFNGFLIVFARKSIIVYENPWTPAGGGTLDFSTMTLVESLDNIGCISRDSIQSIGNDIMFLSYSGVRSLGRTIQEKSMPISDISKNNHEYIMSYVGNENTDFIKSTYNQQEGFYLLCFPSSSKVFYFDVKQPLPDGSLRTTEWNLATTALFTDLENNTYLGLDGYVGIYSGYADGKLADSTGGSPYSFNYNTGWLPMESQGQPLLGYNKIPKNMNALIFVYGTTTVTMKWAYDYDDTFSSTNSTLDGILPAEWGLAEYNIDEYSGGGGYIQARSNMTRSGEVLKFGISVNVNGFNFAIQRFNVTAKIGRMVL